MTGPPTPEGVPPSEEHLTASPEAVSSPAHSASIPPPRARGLTEFTIEGRRAPALFVVGWLAIIAAGGLASLALFGGSATSGSIFWLLTFVAASVGLILLGGSQSLERRAAGAAYAGPSPMLVLVTAAVVTLLAAFVVGIPLQAVGERIPAPLGNLLAISVQAVVFIGVVRLMVVGTGGLSWRAMGLHEGARTAVRSALGGAAFAPAIIGITLLVTAVAVAIAGAVPQSPLPPTGTALGLASNLIAGALIGPFAEEVLFRGFALTAWQRTRGTRSAIIRSSLVFVFAHVVLVGGRDFDQAVRLAFVAGVVRLPVAFALGWIFVRTRSLWASFGLHAGFNAILVIVAEVYARALGA